MHNKETWQLTLTRDNARAMQAGKGTKYRDDILKNVNSKGLKAAGWWVEEDLTREGAEDGFLMEGQKGAYHYEMYLAVKYENGDIPSKQTYNAIVRNVFSYAGAAARGSWELSSINDEEYEAPAEGETPSDPEVGYSDVTIPEDFEKYFAHLFGLDPHIHMVRKAIEAGKTSGWRNRFHRVLIGPPACGKSDLLLSLQRALGEDAVMQFDATATTAAGAIKKLEEAEILPRVAFIEEAEKADEKAFAWLLSVMDQRAEVRKQTARKTIERDTKLLVFLTVNDESAFRRMLKGALASRCGQPIYFQRPSREQLQGILEREVAKIGGNFAWIKPALDWCDKEGISDPRQAIDICLTGADELLTGQYQAMLKATGSTERRQDGTPTEAVWQVPS